jgi:hypothetical protein
MMVYRMTFDIAVSNYCSHDVYTLQSVIAKAICSAKDVLAAEGKKENCLICNSVDASGMIDKQNKDMVK